MALHKKINQPGIYFITFTCYSWLPLIELTNAYDLVYDWFELLYDKGHEVTGFVIMPNHLHMLLHYSGGEKSLNTVIGNGKRFLAYEIVKRLKANGQEIVIKKLQQGVDARDRTRGKKHEVWEDSFDVKECRTEKFVMQKLNYIHNNPCSGKWRLADSPLHYLHSSASFYISGKNCICKVRDYREFLKYGAE